MALYHSPRGVRMGVPAFHTPDGQAVTAVTANEMGDIDRVAVETVGLQLLQMMENAGRILAWHTRDVREEEREVVVVVVAGNGGNGGGGMVCARHLANRSIPVHVVLDRPADELRGVAAHQHGILEAMGLPISSAPDRLSRTGEPAVVVDSLIGYGLENAIRPGTAKYIERINAKTGPTVSLDVPSGLDATTGEIRGVAVSPDRTVTLALPKTGLASLSGDLYAADISIPRTVYERLDIEYERPFGERDWVALDTDGLE